MASDTGWFRYARCTRYSTSGASPIRANSYTGGMSDEAEVNPAAETAAGAGAAAKAGNGLRSERLAPVIVSGEKAKGPASYFPSIEKTYGRPIQEWLALVADRLDGQRHMEVVEWLKTEHGLGHGHANAIVGYVRAQLPS